MANLLSADTDKKYLITTAIDYANDVIHIGHAYEKLLADTVARYLRLRYGKENVYFLTGVDAHGTTNEKAAIAKNVTPEEHVKDIAAKDKEQIDSLNVSYDRFILTTDPDHKQTAAAFFKKAVETGDVYKAVYKGYYCEGCESHKTLSDLTPDKKCPLHLTREIQVLDEENYFFKWSKYTDFLKKLISESPAFVLPEHRKKEMLAFLDNGLLDRPVSRPKSKVSWGIPVPGDEDQVIYVWYDALVNYYTAGNANGFWDENTKIIHFVGKDILRFHALLWPAMLYNVGYRLPDTVYTHGFINLNGQKISKSLGNVIRPSELVEKFGADAVRYYFLKYGPIYDDTNVSLDHLKESYNSDLANGLGNTTARLAKLAQNSGADFTIDNGTTDIWNDAWVEQIENYRVDQALLKIWEKLADLDKHINENTPWSITDKDKLKEVLTYEINSLVRIANCLRPFLPSASQKIIDTFHNGSITTIEPLFPRII